MKKQTIKNLAVIVATAGLFTVLAPSVKATICEPTPKCDSIPDCDTSKDCDKTPCPPCPPPVTKITSVPEPSTVLAGAMLLVPLGVSAVRILRRHKAE